ncbi:peptidylprolyl isomerase [Sphingopyxis sp. SE2]|uniref:peptidylprolyl isomerase n=1 Tax=Sphingopyxis sp. SE2 TaxID=1586240 RepID=UPI0028BFFA11|nr:peptidylprolyl isomerase [Sphingopyxis sp. SE2]MDT7527774.1 peptidylprolyl isomerase [Sphingopyxis sp. SE2]
MRRLDVINIEADENRPAPAMPSACETGGCGGPAELAPTPELPSFGEVSVNGVEISPEAIAQEIQHHPAASPKEAWREAARALAVRELLLQEARRLELEAEPEEDEAGARETEEDAVVRALLEEAVIPETPGEAEARRYYEANADRFRTATIYEASHILIEPEGDSDKAWEEALDQARVILQEVGNDAASFAAAARAYSKCPSAQQDGSLGQVRRGELVDEVQTVIERLADGATAEQPIRSRFGWHIIRLQRSIKGRELPFEVVKDRIADMLEARSWSMGAVRYVASLAERGKVEGVVIGETA